MIDEFGELLYPSTSLGANEYLKSNAIWGGTTWCVAVIVCSLLPKRAGKSVAEDIHVARQATPERIKMDKMIRHYTGFALRGAQSRCMVTYAVASFAASVLVPAGGSSISSSASVLHVVALSFVAVGASVWSTQQPALVFPKQPGMAMAFTIGFGGMFFAGLIALAISLPYRMTAGTATLSGMVMLQIVGLRLLAFPLIGLTGSIICIAFVRTNAGLPIQLRQQPAE